MKSRKRDEIDNFKAWLVGRGAELLVETNEWEIVRFKGGGVTSIIYVNKIGKRTFTGLAQAAWEAFKKNDPAYRIPVQKTGFVSEKSKRNPPVIETLIARDGNECFYCGVSFEDISIARTREHLVAQAHGGPNHISNIFLACVLCNTEAGHLSAPEKIRLRDFKRGYRDSPKVGKATGEGLASPAAFNSTGGD
jgi:5-methylcytosine-specific restriction endonuclease McrA